jgi:hypothetical protein
MFVWAPIPEPYAEMDSVEFCSMVVNECDVALSPGVGFGPGGEGYARFALIENEKRIQQAIRNLRAVSPSSADAVHTIVTERQHLVSSLAPVHTVVVRVWLPDRPGALGQVASRIGAVKGDVLGIEILEIGGGRVIDELVVALPDDTLVDLMVNEVHAIDGVSVEHVRPVTGDRSDGGLLALALAAELAETDRAARVGFLVERVVRLTEAEWVLVVRGNEPIGVTGRPRRPSGSRRCSPAAVTSATRTRRRVTCSGPTCRRPGCGSPPAVPAGRFTTASAFDSTCSPGSPTPCSPEQRLSGRPIAAALDGAQPLGVGQVGEGAVGLGLERGVELPGRPDRVEVGPHAFRQPGEECGAECRGLLVDRASHHAELVGLHLQHEVHRRRTAVDAQIT